eukprot:Plantae.Rhodophyta-Rhodochaete_pulchella.ctg26349.p1 GENE.Plantae.Rhodophyta-Rhodochaete_pulchella.ctg26349~~Plantae.Rhodophyta-Rhodochaete_pulchella.ctg26349.p1  ORF type:complete len:261 (-),score=11.65 Plantae.Rhodophyta-Rhodochaete_pulchella.ctg26349:213-995(-)
MMRKMQIRGPTCCWVMSSAAADGRQRHRTASGCSRQSVHRTAKQSLNDVVAQVPVVVCVRLDSPEKAFMASIAAMKGGIRAVEVALTTPDSLEVIRQLSVCADAAGCLVGAGTVLTPAQAYQVANAGGKFAMSPVTSPEVIQVCKEMDVVPIPGAATPQEIYEASCVHGAPVVKVFPVSTIGGVAFVRSMSGPFPQIPLLPSSGVLLPEVPDYLALPNVWCIGASKQILHPAAVTDDDWDSVSHRASQWVASAQAARRRP